MRLVSKFIPVLFLITGLFLLLQVVTPLVSFKFWEKVVEENTKDLISPQVGNQVLGVSIQNTDNFPLFISNAKREGESAYSYFSLSIPSVKISDELVYVDSNDLTKGLIHLPGAPLPGEKGNVFVSGHSALPRLFAGNQKVAFASLPKVSLGDKIIVSALGTKFSYKVIDIKIVKPEDISVISPPDNTGRYITLMTCVPPGLNTKRLIIVGKLI